jgi:hypothetical protein
LARNGSAKPVAVLAIAILLACWVIDYGCSGVRTAAAHVSDT